MPQLTKEERAAVLLVSLGKNIASEVLGNLSESEVKRLTRAFMRVSEIDRQTQTDIGAEFNQLLKASETMLVDGKEFARDILSGFGEVDAMSDSEDIGKILSSIPEDILKDFITEEHPQTAAFILTQMDPQRAADVISQFDEQTQTEILLRVSNIEPVRSELIAEVKEVLRTTLASSEASNTHKVDGMKAAADIISKMRDTEKVISDISEFDPAAAEQVNQLLFTFEDLLNVPDRSIQAIMSEVPRESLLLALKPVDEKMKIKLLNNVSKRVRDMILEELQEMGPRLKLDVEGAQSLIIDTARRLEAEGRITLAEEDSGEYV